MTKEPPPEILTPEDMAHMSLLNESERRRFKATRAIHLQQQGVGIHKISKIMETSKNTIYKGIRELRQGTGLDRGRVRGYGGGRKASLPKHPEWIDTFKLVIEPHLAGLPQDEDVFWISMTVPQIRKGMKGHGCDISEYYIRQILDSLGFRNRSFIKDLPMREVEERDAQFCQIADVRARCEQLGLPILSIDTKKKELIGNFKRDGKALSVGQPKSNDHDFETFAEAKIVPHGIYDVTKNVGYLTLGTNHDTSKFVCDNIARVWNQDLHRQYAQAHTIVILCDGGGSNSSSHRIVKQDLMDLANRLNMNIFVMHYPPYCSKWNPIEHRLFSQITRSWSGAPLLSIEQAAQRAARTTTSKGLTVHVNINNKTYDIQRPIDNDYERRLKWQVVHRPKLPKWNYLVKPDNPSQLIF